MRCLQMENQISGILSSAAVDISDIDIEEEYRALLGEEVPSTTPPLELPIAPSTPLPTASAEEAPEPIAS